MCFLLTNFNFSWHIKPLLSGCPIYQRLSDTLLSLATDAAAALSRRCLSMSAFSLLMLLSYRHQQMHQLQEPFSLTVISCYCFQCPWGTHLAVAAQDRHLLIKKSPHWLWDLNFICISWSALINIFNSFTCHFQLNYLRMFCLTPCLIYSG